jgi:hypothetical protein
MSDDGRARATALEFDDHTAALVTQAIASLSGN